MATVKDALNIARSLLNDDAAVQWTDAVLIPKLQVAHQQLQTKLMLNSIPVTSAESEEITVAIGEVDLGEDQPEDLVEPVDMMEKDVGSPDSSYHPMIEVPFLPKADQTSSLVYWAWIGGRIRFVGATTARDVLLRYTKQLTTPTVVSEDLGVALSAAFLGTRVAALCGGDATLHEQANALLEDLLRINVKGMQGLPRRRLPYRHRRTWRARAL